jgi:tRNA modification GTPase
MQAPALDDTIVAVSTSWDASAIGIIRLSGPDSFPLMSRLGAMPPASLTAARFTTERLRLDAVLPHGEAKTPSSAVLGPHELPALAFWFRAPKSYTGQDVAELHAPGSLPLLRMLHAYFVQCGARPALPGEFTARAYLNGKLDADQVEAVLSLIHAGSQAAARSAARRARADHQAVLDAARESIIELLARVEAGIDFVDEEDIRFISTHELRRITDRVLVELETAAVAEVGDRTLRPHVALVGLPNAGKSTLFNALLGRDRAIVSPVRGTTRDVLSAEWRLGDMSVILQDMAGLGDSQDAADAHAYIATERAAQRADIAIWVHDASAAWSPPEIEARSRIASDRQLLVLAKSDLAPGGDAGHPPDTPAIAVSVKNGWGLDSLRIAVADILANLPPPRAGGDTLRAAAEAVRRSQAAAGPQEAVQAPEVVAFELLTAWDLLSEVCGADPEEVLAHIFERFCVGK